MKMRRIKNPRSLVLFIGGIAGITFETFYSLQYKQSPDSGLIVLFGAMVGLPAFLSQDVKGKRDDHRGSAPSPKDTDGSEKEPSDGGPR